MGIDYADSGSDQPEPVVDWVEEASRESFPASDAPAWPESATRGRPARVAEELRQ